MQDKQCFVGLDVGLDHVILELIVTGQIVLNCADSIFKLVLVHYKFFLYDNELRDNCPF